MNAGFADRDDVTPPRVWQVGALVRAVADTLSARFNPVSVRGEISSLTRAASGHWYFTLKEGRNQAVEAAQVRCAMFRRAASLVDFAPRDGDLVEVRGRLDIYAPRGDFQLIAESMTRAGQGTLFEQFLKLKAALEGEGLFDPQRKRSLPPFPRGIGIVTSLQAAALHDVATALRRRVPHVPVWIAPASVQGAQAPRELSDALRSLASFRGGHIDLILLVRGGGSIEDLWAFNDEGLARAIAASPIPVVSGVGHETDYTIADFCADLRAPTPTAAAELCCAARVDSIAVMEGLQDRLSGAVHDQLDQYGQRHDLLIQRLARPSHLVARQRALVERKEHLLLAGLARSVSGHKLRLARVEGKVAPAVDRRMRGAQAIVEQLAVRLEAINPRKVLSRGYALMTDEHGHVVDSTRHLRTNQQLTATLCDGAVEVTVGAVRSD